MILLFCLKNFFIFFYMLFKIMSGILWFIIWKNFYFFDVFLIILIIFFFRKGLLFLNLVRLIIGMVVVEVCLVLEREGVSGWMKIEGMVEMFELISFFIFVFVLLNVFSFVRWLFVLVLFIFCCRGKFIRINWKWWFWYCIGVKYY